jgi:hypothetical protein
MQERLRAAYGGGMCAMPLAARCAYEAGEVYVRTLRVYCRGC